MLTARAGETLAPDVLRTHLAAALPDYMIPAAFVALAALPVATSGKLDRKALAAPDATAFAAHAYEAPASVVEAAVARIWADVLNVERVGRQDNFFELGGHSLLVMPMVSRVRETLGAELGLVDAFTRPVLADFAAALATTPGSDDVGGEVGTAPFVANLRPRTAAARTICFLPTLIGVGLHYRELAARLTADVNATTCRLPGTVPGERPLEDFDAIVAHCAASLLEEQSPADVTLVGWSFGGALAFALACQLAEQGTPVDSVVLIDAYDVSRAAGTLLTDPLLDFERFVQPIADSLTALDRRTLGAVFEAGARAFARYHPGRLRARVLHEIRAERTAAVLDDLGQSIRPFDAAERRVTMLPGDHFSLFGRDALPELAATLDAVLSGRSWIRRG